MFDSVLPVLEAAIVLSRCCSNHRKIFYCTSEWDGRNLSPADYRLEPFMHKVDLVCIIVGHALVVCKACIVRYTIPLAHVLGLSICTLELACYLCFTGANLIVCLIYKSCYSNYQLLEILY